MFLGIDEKYETLSIHTIFASYLSLIDKLPWGFCAKLGLVLIVWFIIAVWDSIPFLTGGVAVSAAPLNHNHQKRVTFRN